MHSKITFSFLLRIIYVNICFTNWNPVSFEHKFKSISEQYCSHHLLSAILEIPLECELWGINSGHILSRCRGVMVQNKRSKRWPSEFVHLVGEINFMNCPSPFGQKSVCLPPALPRLLCRLPEFIYSFGFSQLLLSLKFCLQEIKITLALFSGLPLMCCSLSQRKCVIQLKGFFSKAAHGLNLNYVKRY